MEKQKRVYDGGMRSNEPTPNPIDIRTNNEMDKQSFIIGDKFMKEIIKRLVTPGTLDDLKQSLVTAIQYSDSFQILDEQIEEKMYFYKVLNNPELQEWIDLDNKA